MLFDDIYQVLRRVEQAHFLVFDFDGVLCDSVEVKTRAFADIYKSFGEEVVSKVITHHRGNGGMSRFKKFEYYHKHLLGEAISPSKVMNLSNEFSKNVKDKVINSAEIPGANNFLQYCIQRDKQCSVNSATPQDEIREIVDAKGWARFFSIVLGSPSCKTDNLTEIISFNQCRANQVLFFGDALSDFQAAKNAGVDFVGVGGGVRDALANDPQYFYHINNFLEINRLINENATKNLSR